MKIILLVMYFFLSGQITAGNMYQQKMRELIPYAKEHNERYPFAAMIVDEDGNEICRGVNAAATSAIFHGEIVAIRNCEEKFRRKGIDWSKLTLITTAEPCAMCHGAIIWAGIKRVVYGTSIKTLIAKGWHQIDISALEVSRRTNFRHPEVIPDVLSNETDPMFMNLTESASEHKASITVNLSKEFPQ
jgi:tRNA(adenine34) deaminase